mmetsp:Transcript_95037/g.273570  ORF Transcript_95037/g.273570 Transcript_95037/m.273570 type:complete len:241 (-) Transcript_95037:360-1082(-)
MSHVVPGRAQVNLGTTWQSQTLHSGRCGAGRWRKVGAVAAPPHRRASDVDVLPPLVPFRVVARGLELLRLVALEGVRRHLLVGIEGRRRVVVTWEELVDVAHDQAEVVGGEVAAVRAPDDHRTWHSMPVVWNPRRLRIHHEVPHPDAVQVLRGLQGPVWFPPRHVQGQAYSLRDGRHLVRPVGNILQRPPPRPRPAPLLPPAKKPCDLHGLRLRERRQVTCLDRLVPGAGDGDADPAGCA